MCNQLTSQSSSTSRVEQGVWLMVNASVQTNYNLLTPVDLSPVSHLSGGSDKGPGDTNIFNLFQWNGRNSSLHKACLRFKFAGFDTWICATDHLGSSDFWEWKSRKWIILADLLTVTGWSPSSFPTSPTNCLSHSLMWPGMKGFSMLHGGNEGLHLTIFATLIQQSYSLQVAIGYMWRAV